MKSLRIALGVLLSILVVNIADSARADAPATQPSVNLMAMGDWGDGGAGQKVVADRLATFAAAQPTHVDAMLLAGDNFYVPLTGVDDPTWQKLFETMYDPQRLNMPFYPALGNHDYEGNKAQIEQDYSKLHPDSRWKMPAMWHTVEFPADHPLVRLLVLNSNKPNLSAQQWQDQLHFIDTELSKPHDGIWTIAMAHHPLYSNGTHGDTGPLLVDWAPLFAKRKLDIYLCGHDHDLQHLQIDGVYTSFVLVGGGGRTLTVMRRDNRGPFSRSLMGFADLLFTPDNVTVRYIDSGSEEVHEFQRFPNGKVTVIHTTGDDKPTTNPLAAIEGYDTTKPAGK
jgi:hypothetical protein